ncbi:hypothetical protein SCOCK_210086 [Actinacidiphila cocklensis]|uniref:Uncharacterized protein n=1 Tax=Actinacidiphila cocklensis TaxID=887465 RepID=A0A9W4GQU3_9ACTN|nr:hypothetical protein SCOCK_210086 [Actinacidiphila cocklensis]
MVALNQQIAEMDKLIGARFREHGHTEIRASLPGLGWAPSSGPGFWPPPAATWTPSEPPDRLAGFGGVASAARDSGKISGNLHRPQPTTDASNGCSTPPP